MTMKELTLLCDLLELRRLERPLCGQLVEEVQGVDAARQVGFGVFGFLGSRGFLTSLTSGSRSHCRGRLGCCRHLGGSGDALQLSLSSVCPQPQRPHRRKKNQFFQTKQVVKKHRQQDLIRNRARSTKESLPDIERFREKVRLNLSVISVR